MNSSQKIPQILSIVSLNAENKLKLKKVVRKHLGLNGKRVLYLDTSHEILLSIEKGNGKQIEIDLKNNIRLPDEVLQLLEIGCKAQVAMIDRGDAIAIKAFKIVEEEGDHARFMDIETTYNVIRKVETNPLPEQFNLKLVEQYRETTLRYNVYNFLKDRKTLEAWIARQLLGYKESLDNDLNKFLIEQRLEKQQENGSWENSVTITARNLHELADLRMTKQDMKIKKAIDWLMQRPQSVYNPGMWFATDDLIQEQAEVIGQRKLYTSKGPKVRFNIRKATEVNLVCAGEPLAKKPCGPKISWPTALVLEALVKLDCEDTERVQVALRTLATNPYWCDNTYQYGLSDWKRTEPPAMENIEAMKKHFIQFFRYGGIRNPQVLAQADASHQPFYLQRIEHVSSENSNEYKLMMPEAAEGCRIIMIRALSQVSDKKLQKILELFLWNYAALQNFEDGTFSINPQRIFTDIQYAFLLLYSRYDHPIAKLAILRALPWIINNQNNDGSWGKEQYKDAATLAVVRALVSLGDNLLLTFIP